MLNTFVGFTTSVFSASYIGHELETGRLTPAYLRFYHAMYQTLMFAMNLALVANNIGLMWVAIELATLTTVLMVGIYRTHEALEAAWKYFILGSVGIALALFGTILVYMAARAGGRRGHGRHGLDRPGRAAPRSSTRRCSTSPSSSCCSATAPRSASRRCTPGCPTPTPKARRRSRPCSRACCSTSRSTRCCASRCCSRPMRLRFKMLLADPGARARPADGDHGAVSLIFAAFMLYRRRDIKRMFAYSSIEHMGIITFAFGMGGPLANFAGLLHMTMHSLTKSAIFFAVGHIAQVKGTQKIADIRGLTETHPLLGWGLVLGVVAIAGLPPLGIFMSEFLVVTSTFARQPLLAIPLVLGLLVGFGALLLRLTGSPSARRRRHGGAGQGILRADVRASGAGADRRHLAAAAAGRLVPARRAAARDERDGRRDRSLRAARRADGRSTRHRPWPRVVGRRGWLARRAEQLAAGALDAARPVGRSRRGAHGAARRGPRRARRLQPRLPRRRFPSVGAAPSAGDPAGARDPRPLRPRGRGRCRTRGPGSTTASGASGSRSATQPRRRAAEPYAFLPAEGEGLHQIPVGPVHAGIIEPGHFRFTANGETVVRLEERLGYVHKGIEALMAGADLERARAARRPHLGRQHGRLCAGLRARRRRRRPASSRRRARSGCAR